MENDLLKLEREWIDIEIISLEEWEEMCGNIYRSQDWVAFLHIEKKEG